MLTDLNRPAATAPMVADLRDRLRLPQGFADDAASENTLRGLLDVAVRVIEARTGHALIRREFLLRTSAWDGEGRVALPRGPLATVAEVWVERAPGGRAAAQGWTAIEWRGAPAVRLSGAPGADSFVEIRFTAGHGPGWTDAPEDLRYAVTELAPAYFDGQASGTGLLPGAVAMLLEPYRRMRL